MISDGESARDKEDEVAGLELGGGAALPRIALALGLGLGIAGTVAPFAVVERVCFFAAARDEQVARKEKLVMIQGGIEYIPGARVDIEK